MKQKTIEHTNIGELDRLVNEFEANNKVRASQSYPVVLKDDTVIHFRILFYD